MRNEKIRINETIIQGLKKNCDDDNVIFEFFLKLIYEEAEHPSKSWRWKEYYQKAITYYVNLWSETNAD